MKVRSRLHQERSPVLAPLAAMLGLYHSLPVIKGFRGIILPLVRYSTFP
jgi:hypothetical protein